MMFFSIFYACFILLANFYRFDLSVIRLWCNKLSQHFVLENMNALQVPSEPISILGFFVKGLFLREGIFRLKHTSASSYVTILSIRHLECTE